MPKLRAALAGALALLVPLSLASPGLANPAESGGRPAEVASALPVAGQLVGAASVRFLFWRVFDAALWNESGRFSWQDPFALTLFYNRDFSAAELVESSLEEMDRLTDWPAERLSAFGTKLEPCMRAVTEGDRITALSPAPDRAALYHNGRLTCDLQEQGLRTAFFGIWLSEDSQFPDASRELLGGGG
jgi:hypothetical protein